jgi:hypothetical protein
MHIDLEARDAIVERVEASIRERLAEKMETALFKKFGCYVGAATVASDENMRMERLVHRALEEALGDSNVREAADATDRKRRLADIIETEAVHTLMHPVFDITDMSVIGYEALSRGPADSEFERPDKLFRIAYDNDLVLKLERLCRKKALEAAKELPDGRLLFMNVEPEAVGDPERSVSDDRWDNHVGADDRCAGGHRHSRALPTLPHPCEASQGAGPRCGAHHQTGRPPSDQGAQYHRGSKDDR